ncbi:MAG: DUF4097 family beta strand repeat-containing protein [Planctomycetota bacterium]
MPTTTRRRRCPRPLGLRPGLRRSGAVAAVAAAVAATLLAGGCTQFREVVLNASEDAGRLADSISSRSETAPRVRFDTTGPVQVDVELFAGDVTVRVDPAAEGTILRATRSARFGTDREEDSADSLESIRIEADVIAGDLGQRFIVRATSSHPEASLQDTEISIIVPEADGVRVHTGRGRINLKNVAGPLDLATGDGRVRVTTDRRLTGAVDIETGRGDIDLRVPNGTAARLDFTVDAGTISHDVETGRFRLLPGTTPRIVSATIDEGRNLYRLHSGDGDIRFVVTARPNAVGRWIID